MCICAYANGKRPEIVPPKGPVPIRIDCGDEDVASTANPVTTGAIVIENQVIIPNVVIDEEEQAHDVDDDGVPAYCGEDRPNVYECIENEFCFSDSDDDLATDPVNALPTITLGNIFLFNIQ